MWVVEDDPIARKLFSEVARNRGHSVREFGDAEAAIEAFYVAPPNLIILDWILPGSDGLEFCRSVRKLPGGNNTVILVATIRTGREHLQAVMDSGADDYLPKPIDATTLHTRLGVAERLVAQRLAAVVNEGRYHSVITAMAEGVVVLDRKGRIVDANVAAVSLLGRSKIGLIGGVLFETHLGPVRRDGSPYAPNELPHQRALQEGEAITNEIVGLTHQEEETVWLSVNVQPLGAPGNGSPEGVVVSLNDISDRVRAQEQKDQVAVRVQNAQKLESLGVLAGGIAHDFNNLLVGILGNASLALMELPDDSPARQLLEQIESTSMRAADLTNQMLAYSGRGKFVIQPLRLDSLVEEMAQLLATAISKKATIEYDFGENLPTVMADVSQMRQVVMNLITNASDGLGDERGVVRLRTGLEEVGEGEVLDATAHDTLPPAGYVFLEVIDSGEGMSNDVLEKIFDPFFTTKFTGRGLGLAAVLGIVRGHHGAIKVWSRPGRGSSFKIYLPCEASLTAPKALTPPVEDAVDEQSPTLMILVVDDEETVRQVTRAMLERMGFNVIVASDGAEAVKTFERHSKHVAAVLLDLTMPIMSGEEAYRRMLAVDTDAKVLVMSGFNESAAVERFGGVDVDFIQKPFKPDLLREKLIALIGEPVSSG